MMISSSAPVAEVTVEFTDGDAEISRLDISIDRVGSDAWDVLETVSLWVDGDKIAEENADDEDDYINEDDGTIRFSGLNIFAAEDEEVEFIIAVTLQNNIDQDDRETFEVNVDAMRFFDADGVATTLGSTDAAFDATTETFTIKEAGAEDEIIIKTSNNDPNATTLQLEDGSKSDWYTVFVFDIDTDDSENDIELNEVSVSVTVSSSTFDGIVDDVELVIDGTTIDDVNTYTDGATVVLEFDVDGDVVIDAGDRVEAELMLRFRSLDAGNEGITVIAEVTSANALVIDAEGADDLESSDGQLSGQAEGELHTLRTTGISTTLTDDSADVTPVDNNDDYATYELEVEVTAFEQDVFVSVDPAVSMQYVLQDGAGSTSVAGTRSVVLTSSADEGGAGDAFFEINEGETETFTLTVTYTPGVANTASRLVLSSITFDENGTVTTADDSVQTTLPATDYRTSVVTIVN